MKTTLEHAQGLMHKSANDLAAVKAILATEQALDTVCFHAQQAVEKSLKALLALHDLTYPRRHDLAELLTLAKPFAPALQPFEDDILGLTPFAVEVRYDFEFEPSLEQAEKAAQVAMDIHTLVQGIIAARSNNPPNP